MNKYSMTCSCGDTMTVDAPTRDEAVSKLKAMMDENGIKAHMDKNHPGQPLISVADCHAQIERDLKAV